MKNPSPDLPNSSCTPGAGHPTSLTLRESDHESTPYTLVQAWCRDFLGKKEHRRWSQAGLARG